MRFKIGNTWHEAEPDKPLMIEFEGEQLNIAAMPKECTRFAKFFDDNWSEEKRLAWMNEGAKKPSKKLNSVKLEPGKYTIEVRKVITEKEILNYLSNAVDDNLRKISEWVGIDIDKEKDK